MQGRIIKQISNQYTVAIKDKIFTCNARGKFKNMGLSPLVGDMVDINTDTRTIEKILPRKIFSDSAPIVVIGYGHALKCLQYVIVSLI